MHAYSIITYDRGTGGMGAHELLVQLTNRIKAKSPSLGHRQRSVAAKNSLLKLAHSFFFFLTGPTSALIIACGANANGYISSGKKKPFISLILLSNCSVFSTVDRRPSTVDHFFHSFFSSRHYVRFKQSQKLSEGLRIIHNGIHSRWSQ